ncbi:MAG TPA: heavy metal translocating P-type ATPase metal-binding domain-containing protein [Bacteroidia bacterium]|nr:heavy metal translocating P-type ATPase metal-binding domain-containing protein [Bacteroidia bacterium]
MKITPASLTVDKRVTCYHCGEVCPPVPVNEDGHDFCCEGCHLVYDLLKQNDLCSYYDISKAPGRAAEDAEKNAVYASLDEPEVRSRMLRFEDEKTARVVFHVPSMHCSSCIWLLEHLYRMETGILSSTVNFPAREVSVDFDPRKIKLSRVAALFAATGYAPSISLGDLEISAKKKRFNPRVLKIGVAGFCFGNIMLLSFPEYLSLGDLHEVPALRTFFAWLSLALSIPVIAYSASEFFIFAWKAIRFRSLNIDAPVALAISVTFLRSVYEITTGSGPGYLDSMSGIVFFMLIGRYFQDRTHENLSFERDYRSYFPIAVTALKNGKEISLPVTRLKAGDRIIIRNGELVPADCILLDGNAEIDYSFVTGESEPVTKENGEKIFAGARQTSEAITLEVLKETSQSYLTQLWNNDSAGRRNVEEHKSYIDRVNRWFTLGVLLLASSASVVWLFIQPSNALNVFVSVLIVACPCTLLLASTFTNASVLHWFGKYGLYLKNSAVIEKLATASAIVFDKTGTITEGNEGSTAYEGKPLSAEETAALALLASQSGHPLSRRIAAVLKKGNGRITGYSDHKGKGISGNIGGRFYMIGSADFIGEKKEAKTAEAWIAIDGKVKGKFVFRNRYRAGLAEIISALTEKFSTELLSGDNEAERENLQPVFGNEMRFNQSPAEKLERIRVLQDEGKKVIMVGDGLNDAGALLRADAGIAVSDSMNNYFPACDAILDGKSFARLPLLLRYSRIARRIIIVTFLFSVIYNIAGIYFSVRGELSPVIAAVLMPASSLSVILITTLSSRISAKRLFGAADGNHTAV